VLCEIATPLHVDGCVICAMNDQCWHLYCRQDAADINLAVHPHQCSDASRAGTRPFKPAHPL